jgi:carbonic anhydrase/acetyltransferase-like protein (isoleucine patch superfamily)
MIRKNPSGHLPVVHDSAFVDPTAILCGKVVVEENVFIGPYAVIRADEVDANGDMEPIIIGANSNIQDGVVIHCKAGGGVTIGRSSSIAHRSIVHGRTAGLLHPVHREHPLRCRPGDDRTRIAAGRRLLRKRGPGQP